MDAPIVITSSELADYTVLYRKQKETIFRRDFLARHGSGPQDPAVLALNTQLSDVESRLKPIEERIRQVDLVMVVPKRADLISINAEINQHSREALDTALKSRAGPVFELLRKRAEITKQNYERREEIARLTILLNMLPRPEAESLRTLVESNSMHEVTIASLTGGQQQEMVTLLGRLNVMAFVSDNLLTLDKKKVDSRDFLSWPGEVSMSVGNSGSPGMLFWVNKNKLNEWEENEKHMTEVGRKIQMKLAQSQAASLNETEQKEFESLQQIYLELRNRRLSIAGARQAMSVSLPKVDKPPERAGVPTIDLGPTMPAD